MAKKRTIAKSKSSTINGSPTKELFVNILTRDLSIEDAINDLVDNCIDGATRLRRKRSLKGLYINIEFDKDSFKIKDNCGGIASDVARNYAFRFGRPKGMNQTDYSIGQFGVGMKRAFFKLGTNCYVHSTHATSEFSIIINIDDWLVKTDKQGKDDWNFEFEKDIKEGLNIPEDKTGTEIEISPLRKEISSILVEKGSDFISNLILNMEYKQMESIYRGLSISINGQDLENRRPKFKVSENIKVAKLTKIFKSKVKLELYAGLGEPVHSEGGWYVFCNDRLLLGPEQTAITGWTGKGQGGVANYHHQFHRFRGIAKFYAKDASLLPWNTSKNNIDASSAEYLHARGLMVEMMKPIITILNFYKKDNEKNPDGSEKEYKPYVEMVDSTTPIEFKDVAKHTVSENFSFPRVNVETQKTKMVTISYKRNKPIADKVKKALNADSYAEVGKMTFDYFIDMEEI